MITNKLAGLLATLAFLLLTATWCLRTVFDLPAMDPDTILTLGVGVLILYYFVLGRAVAWIGVRLVQERISEIRAEEESRRHEATLRQQEIKNENNKVEIESNKAAVGGVAGALGSASADAASSKS